MVTRRCTLLVLLTLLALRASVPVALARTHEVGPGREHEAIGDVPWELLGPDDEVAIHWRPEPYREKWVIAIEGGPEDIFVVRGVRGPSGERPVIEGADATTRQELDYWNESRSVLKIGGASVPSGPAALLVVEGLEIRGAHERSTFTDDRGQVQSYARNAAAIHVEDGTSVEIRDCELHDSGNGLFVSSLSSDVLVADNVIHGNGNVGSAFEHNSYTEASGITFEGNVYGPLRPGADGNNLKDRSAGLVVRYNWIEGGNRQLDLVDSANLRGLPEYRVTRVYGNVLLELEGEGNRQVVHYGGDSGTTDDYRKGMLHFYHNTIVSTRTDRTVLFRLSTDDERVDARANVYHALSAGGDTLALSEENGVIDWGRNWVHSGWRLSFPAFLGTFNDLGATLEGDDPLFTDAGLPDLHLQQGSPCRDSAGALHPDAAGPTRSPLRVPGGEPRPDDGLRDLGAYEDDCPRERPLHTGGLRLRDASSLTWAAGSEATSWDVVEGDLAVLRSTADLGASLVGCLADDAPSASTNLGDAAPGGSFYLVRGGNCAGEGSFDSGPAGWGTGRDLPLRSSPLTCP